MPTLHILSDLHVEFAPFVPPPTDADVVVLAGDIHTKCRGVAWAKAHFPRQPVVMVHGNHDHWGGNMGKTTANAMADANVCDGSNGSDGSNVHFLENTAVVVAGIRFVGATLWTDYRLTGNQPLAMFDAHARMNDFKKMRDDQYRKVRPPHLLALHVASRQFLEDTLATPFDGPTVVVTHHAPCELSIAKRYRGQTDSHLSASYASRLDHLMGEHVPLWVHGHTHDSMDYEVGGTRVVCNPRGYAPNELNPAFDPGWVVEVAGGKRHAG